jgi:hypothetical protein
LNIFFILRVVGKRKKERKRVVRGLEKLKNLLENNILNLENIIRKMNKMILIIFYAWVSSYFYFFFFN